MKLESIGFVFSVLCILMVFGCGKEPLDPILSKSQVELSAEHHDLYVLSILANAVESCATNGSARLDVALEAFNARYDEFERQNTSAEERVAARELKNRVQKFLK